MHIKYSSEKKCSMKNYNYSDTYILYNMKENIILKVKKMFIHIKRIIEEL